MISISLITDVKYAKEAANIHVNTFKGFFLTFLGEGFLRELYKGFINHNKSGIYGAFDGDKLIGFAAFSEKSGEFYKFLIKKSIHKFFLYSCIAFIKKPSIMFRLFRALMYPNKNVQSDKYVELISIGVSPTYKGKNVGSLLLKTLIDSVDGNIFSYIKLNTDKKSNDAANHFYQKNGFVIDSCYTTPEGREMNEYRYYIKEKSPINGIRLVNEGVEVTSC